MQLLDLSAPSAGLPVSSASGAWGSAQEGEWMDAGLHTLVLGAETAGFLVDPVGSSLRWGTEWVLEHVRPLHVLLDGLAGNADAVNACAAQMALVASRVRASSPGHCRGGVSGWVGEAATAQEQSRRRVAAVEELVADQLDSCQRQLRNAAVLVGVVRDFVRMLIAEVVTAAARAVAGATLTFGSLTPVVVGDVVRRVATAVSKAAARIKLLVASLARLELMIGSWARASLAGADGLRAAVRALPPLRGPDIRTALREMPQGVRADPSQAALPLISAIATGPEPLPQGHGSG